MALVHEIINPLHFLRRVALGFAVVFNNLHYLCVQCCLVSIFLGGQVVQNLSKTGVCRLDLDCFFSVGFYVVNFVRNPLLQITNDVRRLHHLYHTQSHVLHGGGCGAVYQHG